MDLATRKYNFIRELIDIDKESIIEALERVLKQIREEEEEEETLDDTLKQELDNRLSAYQDNPEDLLDWENVKNDW